MVSVQEMPASCQNWSSVLSWTGLPFLLKTEKLPAVIWTKWFGPTAPLSPVAGTEVDPNDVTLTPIPRTGTTRSSSVSNRRVTPRWRRLRGSAQSKLNMNLALEWRTVSGRTPRKLASVGRVRRGTDVTVISSSTRKPRGLFGPELKRIVSGAVG